MKLMFNFNVELSNIALFSWVRCIKIGTSNSLSWRSDILGMVHATDSVDSFYGHSTTIWDNVDRNTVDLFQHHIMFI